MSSTSFWLPLASAGIAVLGTLGGVFITQWWIGRRENETWRRQRATQREDQWIADRRSYYLPLREAAHDLKTRLEDLARIYRVEAPAAPFTPESLSRDFRELYRLSWDEIDSRYNPATDPNQPRRDDPHAVQQLRTRMSQDLNFATSIVYSAARYLAWAQLNRRLLEEARTSLPAQPAEQLLDQLEVVSKAWQGPTGAGLPIEQQESIGEIMLTPDGHVITQFEFRERLLKLPGWEQYAAMLTFFLTENDDFEKYPIRARLNCKVDNEILTTVTALCTLIASLDQITTLVEPPGPDWTIEPRPCDPPWMPRRPVPAGCANH